MSWVFRIAIACVFVWLFYRMARWAGRPAKSARSVLGWSSAMAGFVLMVPTTTVLVFTFHGNLAVAGTVAGLLVGLVLFLMLGPVGVVGGPAFSASVGLVKYLLLFGSTGLLASLAAAFGFRFAPVGVFSPLLWGSLILFGVLMIARLPRRRRPSDPALLPPQEH